MYLSFHEMGHELDRFVTSLARFDWAGVRKYVTRTDLVVETSVRDRNIGTWYDFVKRSGMIESTLRALSRWILL